MLIVAIELVILEGCPTWGWEFEPEITSGRLVSGANYALCCWRVQRGLCKALNAPFNPPHASHVGYVSAGVLDGTFPLEGVRYPSTTPTTGWFITTDLYNGDIRTLQTMHLHHITKDMPALISVLALPAGLRFTVGGKTGKADIWYDERVATERSIQVPGDTISDIVNNP